MVLLMVSLLCIQCGSLAGNMKQQTDSLEVRFAATAEITCPQCGHKKVETLPTEICQIRYTCEGCKASLTPQGDDCCVFCSYGDHKCPSKQ